MFISGCKLSKIAENALDLLRAQKEIPSNFRMGIVNTTKIHLREIRKVPIRTAARCFVGAVERTAPMIIGLAIGAAAFLKTRPRAFGVCESHNIFKYLTFIKNRGG